MKYTKIAVLATVLAATSLPAFAETPQKSSALGRFEGYRDLNLFQVEPSIINEHYYTSGQSERTQYVGNVLPAGAPIPDNDAPAPVQKITEPAKSIEPAKGSEQKPAPAASTTKSEATPEKSAAKTKKLSMLRHSGEHYYTSGGAERHQHIGNTLPAGAPIPDNE